MKRTLPGEVWWVDFGLAAKVRPALILSDYPADDELALLVVIPHTTALARQPMGTRHPQTLFEARRISPPASPTDPTCALRYSDRNVDTG
ncbi:MAG TPA: type II toxin-antitoxin system PemK/MazF family toxin [Methylomirabilota bacterium]|nr:type II toxin-antitoxin system PemK/MazF family toxin [Methylomirabilota bacterium]